MVLDNYLKQKSDYLSIESGYSCHALTLSDDVNALIDVLFLDAKLNNLAFTRKLFDFFEKIKEELHQLYFENAFEYLNPFTFRLISDNRLLCQEILELLSGLVVYDQNHQQLKQYVQNKILFHLVKVYALKNKAGYYNGTFNSYKNMNFISALSIIDLFENEKTKKNQLFLAACD